MKRAVLLQLPVPSFLWPVLDANIPLAAGYLAAWARLRRSGWEVEILPWTAADVLGDEALFRTLTARSPDLVGFSLYLWNAERSLYLARKLTEVGIPVLVGGPEVSPENRWIWQQGGFRAAIGGEGEDPFVGTLEALSRRARLEDVPGVLTGPYPGVDSPTRPLLDLSRLPSPYLSGFLEPSPDGSVWFETQRGCPFRCAYCHYGKQYGGVRPFPSGWLSTHLNWSRERDVREIYLMDPSFNVRRDWEEVLRTLEGGNPDRRIRLHTELVAESLRPGDGMRLALAGLRSCEIGLQSVRPEALSRVGRTWNRERWIRGVRELLDAGVSVTVGLIVGLPGDDLGGFEESLSFVLNEVPSAGTQVFPLSVLPGTELAGRAEDLGLATLARPPYTVTRTTGYGPEELSKAFDLYEDVTGVELDPFGAPPIAGPWEGAQGQPPPYLSGVRVHATSVRGGWADAVAEHAARNLCVWIQGWNEGIPAELGRLSRLLPHCVLTVVLEDGVAWPPERLSSVLSEAGTGDRYLNRYFAFLYGPGARVVPRLAVLVNADERPGSRWLDAIRGQADIVWGAEVKSGWVGRMVEATREGETAYLRGQPPDGELRLLAESLAKDAGDVLFESKTAELKWQRFRTAPIEADVFPPCFRAEEKRTILT